MSKEKQNEEIVELSNIIGCAVNDWGDFCEVCHKDGYSPTDTLEEYVAVSVLTKGYRKQREARYCADPNYRTLGNCGECGGDVTCLNNYCPNCGAKLKGV